MRDSLIVLAQRRVLPQARAYPFNLLDVQLALQTTGAGTTVLRWRNIDRSSTGVALWESLLGHPAIPASLIDDLYAMELQRIALNMQISLTHSVACHAKECASNVAQAEAIHLRRILGYPLGIVPLRSTGFHPPSRDEFPAPQAAAIDAYHCGNRFPSIINRYPCRPAFLLPVSFGAVMLSPIK
ncbi:DUF3158 family protein [Cupriavidus necator]